MDGLNHAFSFIVAADSILAHFVVHILYTFISLTFFKYSTSCVWIELVCEQLKFKVAMVVSEDPMHLCTLFHIVLESGVHEVCMSNKLE